jgi:hypothetical protein
MNVFGDHNTVKPTHGGNSAGRTSLFEFDGIMGRILRSRVFVCSINNALFSHAGVLDNAFQGSRILSEFIMTVNNEVRNKDNFKEDTLSEIFQHSIWGVEYGVLWTRKLCSIKSDYCSEPVENAKDVPLVPKNAPRISCQFTGHNKYDGIRFVSQTKDNVKQANLMCATTDMKCRQFTDASKILPTESAYKIKESDKYLIITDVISGDSITNKTISIPYTILHKSKNASNSARFDWLSFKKYQCEHGTCELHPLTPASFDDFRSTITS